MPQDTTKKFYILKRGKSTEKLHYITSLKSPDRELTIQLKQ
jgi:hypothetical protein